MSRYPLNLPTDLKREAERWAAEQGMSLNQFILWALAERTLTVTAVEWGWDAARLAEEYGLSIEQAREALAFAAAHRPEIEAQIAAQAEPETATASD